MEVSGTLPCGSSPRLAVTVKPSPSGVNMSELSLDKFLLEWYGPQCHGDTIEFEEFLSNLGKAGCSTVVRRFLDCHASDPGRAQAILSMMINPKFATEICLVDGSSGDRASDSTIVHLRKMSWSDRNRRILGMRFSLRLSMQHYKMNEQRRTLKQRKNRTCFLN